MSDRWASCAWLENYVNRVIAGLIWDDYKCKEQRGKWNSWYSEQGKGKREGIKKLWP